MNRFLRAIVVAVIIACLPAGAHAAGANDADVRALIRDIFESEVAAGSYDGALENLRVARVVCEGNACSKEVEAELLVAIGTVEAKVGKSEEARKTFVKALDVDPGARLKTKYADDKVRAAWDKAKGALKTKASQGCRGAFEGGDKPTGWLSAEAYFCYRQAKDARADEDWKRCHEDARASLAIESRIGTRSVLAFCLERDNRWTQAIEQYQELVRRASSAGQFTDAAKSKARAQQLQRDMPAVVLQIPKDVEDVQLTLDGTELPVEILDAEIPIDPGEHKIVASAMSQDGVPLGFEQTVTIDPGRTVTLLITLTPGNPDPETRALLKCLASGKSQAECLASASAAASDFTITISTEFSAYHDDMAVDVISPHVGFQLEHVTAGWGVGASFLVDVVTAASTDIVATASPRWQEVRWVPAANGHVKVSDWDFALNANLSHEPDYIATGVGANVSVELADKTITPSAGYEFSYDISGKGDTPFDVFSTTIKRHAVNLGLGMVLTKATFGSLAYTMVFENGDASKPYRHIPLFSTLVAPGVEPGLIVDAVNFFREPERPLEQLPTNRKRFALAGAVAHRFADATLRLNQRLYFDTWGTKATTTDGRFMYDVVKEFRIWPHLRFHAQTGADFYELAYTVTRLPDGSIAIPALRAGDRELGPILSGTVGGGARLDFGDRRQYGLTLSGDFVYTRFLNHLFVKQRLGYFGAIGFDMELE